MIVAAVVIGRNEGARLKACLASLVGQVDRIAYVDSGSTDDSVAHARALGLTVVELDTATPFTAARGRNAGFAALRAQGLPDAVQFVDGDCIVEPGWIAAATAALAADPTVGIVTGWRTEVSPRANAFHAMTEIEWHQPAGEIAACGGDMMVRVAAFEAVGGFDGSIIASEDEDFVIRVHKAGFRALRLPQVMTRHDIAMTRIGAWWRRNLRSGHGFAEVGDLHPPHFRAERRRVRLFGALLPGLFVLGLATGLWWLWLGVLVLTALSLGRTARWLSGQGLPAGLALRVAGLFALAKVPQAIGMARFRLRRLRGVAPRIIEYKRGPT